MPRRPRTHLAAMPLHIAQRKSSLAPFSCGGTFSLEGPEGKAFHTRSRLFTDAEWAELQAAGLV